MLKPPQLGELTREGMNEAGWNVTETAARLTMSSLPTRYPEVWR